MNARFGYERAVVLRKAEVPRGLLPFLFDALAVGSILSVGKGALLS